MALPVFLDGPGVYLSLLVVRVKPVHDRRVVDTI
jgi:hypothetical protein